MIKADLGRQLMIYVENQLGSLAQITSEISSSGINLIAMCAYSLQDRVAVMFTAEDNNAAKRILEKQGYNVEQEEVILLSIDNRAGSLQRVTDKLAEEEIDLFLVYGSVSKKARVSRIVMITENNLDALTIIKTELERND